MFNEKNLRYLFTFCWSIICFSIYAQERLVDLEGKWKFSIGDDREWLKPGFNDAKWESIDVPGLWEDQGFHGYDGFAWYRTTFDGKSLPKNQTLYLDLGYIDDADEVYVNGKMIGFSGFMPPKFKTAYSAKRLYHLPAEYINFNGQNTIAVRVFDVVNEGGIVSGRPGIYRSDANAALIYDLQGLWQFKRGRINDSRSWDEIMVPIPWEAQGYDRYDGWATYKRTFRLPENMDRSDLVLIMGKVDDFDKTYFNGALIGATRDNERLGHSRSYNELRAYDIPSELIRRGEENTIIIEVEDIGLTGGIWRGPVGITTKTRYYRYLR